MPGMPMMPGMNPAMMMSMMSSGMMMPPNMSMPPSNTQKYQRTNRKSDDGSSVLGKRSRSDDDGKGRDKDRENRGGGGGGRVQPPLPPFPNPMMFAGRPPPVSFEVRMSIYYFVLYFIVPQISLACLVSPRCLSLQTCDHLHLLLQKSKRFYCWLHS